jgi:NADH-quinone oxidoreductase subunit K
MMDKMYIIDNLNYHIVLGNIIFIGGLLNVLNTKNPIIWLASIELLFISSFLNFIIYSIFYLDIHGFLYSLLVLILAATESAIGLSLIALFFIKTKQTELDFSNDIKTKIIN